MALTPSQLSARLRPYSDSPKTYLRPFICPFHELLELVPRGGFVYDIGCGGGAWLALVAQVGGPARIGGYDIEGSSVRAADALLALACPTLERELRVWTDAGVPPDVVGYDTVTMIDVLHHVPPADQPLMLASIWRNMKCGSRLILKDIDGASLLVSFNRLHDLLVTGATGHEMRASDACSALRAVGFDTGQVHFQRTLVYPHYWVVAVKPE